MNFYRLIFSRYHNKNTRRHSFRCFSFANRMIKL